MGAWVQRGEGERQLVEFRYERFSSFHFNCGRVDHIERTCKYAREDQEGSEYGVWLTASAAQPREIILNVGKNHRKEEGIEFSCEIRNKEKRREGIEDSSRARTQEENVSRGCECGKSK